MRSKYKGKQNQNNKYGNCIYATIPMIKESIPLIILFRALNCLSDKHILNRISFDSQIDNEIAEVLRNSLEEAKIIDS